MKIMLISSQNDEAGKNIRSQFLALRKANEGDVVYDLMEVEGRLIDQDRIDETFCADLIVFLSRHTSTHPSPLLSVHVTGNLSHADLGGKRFSLPPASPFWMRSVLRHLSMHAPPGYRVTYEVTHHGPTELSIPSFFAEIGSTSREWKDPRAGRAIAQSIYSARPEPALPLLGIGGNHYATRATEMARESQTAFGHIIHSREVPSLDLSILSLLKERSDARAAYIDKKALPPHEILRIEHLLGEAGLPLLGEGEIRMLGDLSWEAYQSLTRHASSCTPFCRLIVHHLSGEGIPVIVRLDDRLLTEALRANREALLEGLQCLPLAHLTGSDGTPLPIFLTFEGKQSSVINHLIRLCVKIIVGNQKTSLDGDSLTIYSMRFDPHKARELGIPSGPLYGVLSAGHAVEKDGRTITSEMVQTVTKRILHIPGLRRYV
jgi:D-aminoacyl-tRNA deacylase